MKINISIGHSIKIRDTKHKKTTVIIAHSIRVTSDTR